MRVGLAARAMVVVACGVTLAMATCGYAAAEPRSTGERYFIDFRARSSHYIGHTYVIYYRVDATGHVAEQHLAGLVPEEDVWNGILSPIRATIRKYKDDTRVPAGEVYRRELSGAQYAQVVRTVQFFESRPQRWHLIFNNCNDFGIQIAETLGLWRPPSLMPPSVWVGTLRALNER